MNNLTAYNSQIMTSFRNSAQQQSNFAKKIEANNERVLKYSPFVIGAMNAFCWGSVGYMFDRMCSKMLKLNSNKKTSAIINGVIGTAMGTYAYCQAKKLQKTQKAEPQK